MTYDWLAWMYIDFTTNGLLVRLCLRLTTAVLARPAVRSLRLHRLFSPTPWWDKLFTVSK